MDKKNTKAVLYSRKRYIERYGMRFRLMFHTQPDGLAHYHDFNELVIVLDGNAIHKTEERDYPISSGDVFLIKKNKIHYYWGTDNLKLANIMFDFDTLNVDWKKLREIPGYTALFETEPELRDRSQFKCKHTLNAAQLDEVSGLLQKILREEKEKPSGWIMMAQTLLQELLIMLARSYSAASKIQSQKMIRLSRMMQFIEQNYAKKITRDRIMREGMTSNAVGTRIFKDLLGKTPFEYLIQTRIRHAAELLENSDQSVSDIAYECGFHDSNYFSMQFRKVTGLSPREFARKKRDGAAS